MSPAPLRLRLLGPFTVEGELPAPVPTGKARRALAVLAERRGEFVPVSTLIDALWDGDAPERADRNVAALISRLRRALGRDRIDGTAAGLPARPRRRRGRPPGGRRARATPRSSSCGARPVRAGLHQRRAGRQAPRRRRRAWPASARTPGCCELRREVARAAAPRPDLLERGGDRAAGPRHRASTSPRRRCGTTRSTRRPAGRSCSPTSGPGRSGTALVVYRVAARRDVRAAGQRPLPCHPVAVPVDPAVGEPGRGDGRRRAADRRPRPPRARRSVGRDRELAELGELWAGAAAGTPVLAVVTGEAGIGKSALVAAFAAEPRRTGALVLAVGCFEAERSLYLQPLVEAVRAVVHRIPPAEVRELAGSRLGTLAELVPELADLVGAAPYQRAGPGARAPPQPRRAGRVLRPAQRPPAGAAGGRGRRARRAVDDRGAAPARRPLERPH